MTHLVPGVLARRDPDGDPAPLLFEVPRSGAEYPRDFQFIAPFDLVHSRVSMYVETLYGDAPSYGASLIWALFPNSYIDANRAADDIDPEQIDGTWPGPLAPGVKSGAGMGLVRHMASAEAPMYDRRLTVAEVQARIDRYSEPYHREVGSIVEGMRERFGAAFHVSCHCMSAVGNDQAEDVGVERPDFCVGDRGGTTSGAAFRDAVAGTLADLGYRVTINDPYQGVECIRRHSDPERGVHSVQLEMKKSLYMDEDSFAPTDGFAQVQRDLGALEARLAAFAREQAGRPA